MKKLITIMSAEEVVGSIAHLLRNEYSDLLDRIEKEIEEKTLDEILHEQFVLYGGIIDFHMLNPIEKEFLKIYDSESYYICTFGDEYCKNIF